MNNSIVFVDSEIDIKGEKIQDLGAVDYNASQFHSANKNEFSKFVGKYNFVCGHNIIHHDLKYISDLFYNKEKQIFIDTLYISPILFPKNPYHKLLKDDKLQTEELNNPLNDSIKAKDLFFDEINAFIELPAKLKLIFCSLLYQFPEFNGFFKYNNFKPYKLQPALIKEYFKGKICENANIEMLINNYPIELAYALAIINVDDATSITPPWVLHNYPKVENVIKFLKYNQCAEGCEYCSSKLDVKKQLKNYFGYDDFRKYNGEPLQEKAAAAAVHGESMIAVFPTGGGKSITFQLPALIAGQVMNGLTVVISPLQSLMKDQVDNLVEKGLVGAAVTINGLLDPIERKNAIERVLDGSVSLLYISPEQLRSKTIEKILFSRNVVRFVIDEAHCFSAWGQDFRVDYLYIGDFIKELQIKKNMKKPIPVSCFTATAKQKVITDICDYFREKLDLNLEVFATTATRKNLHYTVLYEENDDAKYNALRSLIEGKDCPTIVYVSRTRRTIQLAEKLTSDGFSAKPFNGKMDPNDKIANQEAFIKNEIQVMVATSAFGMGVDKPDVRLVVHYDISDSLENYVQEAGRAGRDQSLNADCYILYNNDDLDKHFMLLNQTKLSISEIQQVWKAIKDMTKYRDKVFCSAFEIARQAGWDDEVKEVETRVKTAVLALENAGYIERGNNIPHVYATSILSKNMIEASKIIEASDIFDDEEKGYARLILSKLMSYKSRAEANNDDPESRVDYLAEVIGLKRNKVVDLINKMRQLRLLDDKQDMTAYIRRNENQNRSLAILEKFIKLERFLAAQMEETSQSFNLKELNDLAIKTGVKSSSIKNIKTVNYFWKIKGYIDKSEYNSQNKTEYIPLISKEKFIAKLEKRYDVARFILNDLYNKSLMYKEEKEEVLVGFSLVGLYESYTNMPRLDIFDAPVVLADIEEALLYLSKIGAISIQGGFLVFYSAMEIKRLIRDNKIRYKNEDYKMLNDFYKQRIQQIHIVGEYANLMVSDYNAAMQYVNDYFQMDYKKFISKYFKGDRVHEIERNITPKKYKQLIGELSSKQSQIINDDTSKYIVVAAGPGSGKTKVLVHKLASLMLLEDVKHEQLLMLTFSRAAATEFKKRLISLIGNAASFIEIKTFHSYCFDLLGKVGDLDSLGDVVKDATELIANGEVDLGRITKTVLVIDEAQDMDENEYKLVHALMDRNEDMRVIAVGDDDQNIYEFRGASSKYLKDFIMNYDTKKYEMTDNFRSAKSIVKFSNLFAKKISDRMKSEEGNAVQDYEGVVEIVKHTESDFEEAVVNQIINKEKDGTSCILTNTNEEALKMLGLLTKKSIKSKLIQSIDGFEMSNLIEVKHFLNFINNKSRTPVISNGEWDRALDDLRIKYGKSFIYDTICKMLNDFAQINSVKYKTDLEEFIRESKFEDFYHAEQGVVIISTIHKSKGREFDNVYMYLNNVSCRSDQDKRKLYVGLTRAKKKLYIHCNNDIFDDISDTVKVISDRNKYEQPQELIIQLSYKDVVLDVFRDKQNIISKLYSGMELKIDGEYLCLSSNGGDFKLAKFSKAFKEKIEQLMSNGYKPYRSEIRFVVSWKPKDEDKELYIILPDLRLKR